MCYLPLLCLLSLCLGCVLCFVCEDDIWKNCKMRAERGECEVREETIGNKTWSSVSDSSLVLSLFPYILYFDP